MMYDILTKAGGKGTWEDGRRRRYGAKWTMKTITL